MVAVCLCVAKHQSHTLVFLLPFEELVLGGVLRLLALLCMGRCMKLNSTLTPAGSHKLCETVNELCVTWRNFRFSFERFWPNR